VLESIFGMKRKTNIDYFKKITGKTNDKKQLDDSILIV
jgi:hypothetical protein